VDSPSRIAATIRPAGAFGLVLTALVAHAPAQAGNPAGRAPLLPLSPLRLEAVVAAVPIAGARQPLPLQPLPVGAAAPRATIPSPLGPLPASWRGDLSDGGGSSRWQLDLAADGSFQLRQTFLNRPAPNSVDDIGLWRLEPGPPRATGGSPRLVLRGGREAPLLFQPLAGGAALRKLDPRGLPSSLRPDRLQRWPGATAIEPRLHLLGMFRYLADAASIRLCATGAQLPVAMEQDFLRLEKAYLGALPRGGAGAPLLVNLEGLITSRPSAEPSQGPVRTLVVERFLGIHPARGCPPAPGVPSAVNPSSGPPAAGQPTPSQPTAGLPASGQSASGWPTNGPPLLAIAQPLAPGDHRQPVQ
jgi:hypothetical protein